MYLDDILIYSEIEAEHKIHVKCVLQKLCDVSLQADIIKCAFHIKKISYLELIIITEEVKMNSVKVSIIVKWLMLGAWQRWGIVYSVARASTWLGLARWA